MKIALAHKRFELKGGTERVFYRTAIGLRDRGHDVHLFCQTFRMPVPEGVTGHVVPGVTWPRTARLLTFGVLAPLYIARFQPDVVLSFDRLIKQDVFRSGGGPHKTFLSKMRSNAGALKSIWYLLSPYHRAVLAVERRQISRRGCQAIVAVCEQTRRDLIGAYGIAESRIKVIHNGVDLERFHPARRVTQGAKLRAALRIPPQGRVILFVGSGFRRKGLERLLRLWRVDPPPDCYLVVVGNDAKLASFRHRWRAQPQVIFAGASASVENYYAAAHLLALPSVQEAFGNVVLEALAAGVPVMTVDGVGALDKVSDELRLGVLRDPDDADEVRAKILQLTDPSSWPSLSQACRAAAEQYTWTDYLDRLEILLYESAAVHVENLTPIRPIGTEWSELRS